MQISSLKFQIYRQGFTLIELLVVITISAIVMGLTTTSYLTFERNQKLKNAAATLKNDLRYVQSKATTGDKSLCPSGSTLVGWYIRTGTGSGSYSIYSDCRTGSVETKYEFKVVNLPSGITVGQRSDGSFACDGILTTSHILFEPLKIGATFHRGGGNPTPPFYNYATTPPTYTTNQVCASGDLDIVLVEQQNGAKWKVTVKSSGDINDAKI